MSTKIAKMTETKFKPEGNNLNRGFPPLRRFVCIVEILNSGNVDEEDTTEECRPRVYIYI